MINVLFVNDNLRLPAGITMVMKNIIDNCDQPDIKFSILTYESTRNNAVEYFLRKGVEVYYMPGATATSSSSRFKNTFAKLNVFSLLSLRLFLKNFFSNYHFDVVHSHFSQIDKTLFRIARNNGTSCCISHSHSSQLSDSRIRAIRNKLMCSGLINHADYCAACSNSAGIALFGSGFLKSPKRLIIKNGIALSKFVYDEKARKAIRAKFGISDDTVLLGNVGRLNKVKNQGFLLDVLCELHKRKKKYALMLVGSGECESKLKNKAGELGLSSHVVFAGAQENVSSFLSAFDVFVMPSLHEGLGIAAVEAQANGLECVLSSGVPSDVNMTDVVFLSLNSTALDWADSIDRMKKLHHIEYNKRVRENGYDIVEVCKDLCAIYVSKGNN